MPRLENSRGEALYYNVVEKNGKIQYVLKGIGSTVILSGTSREGDLEFSPKRHRLSSTFDGTVLKSHTDIVHKAAAQLWAAVAFLLAPLKLPLPSGYRFSFFQKKKQGLLRLG